MTRSYCMYPANPSQDEAWEAGKQQAEAFASRHSQAEVAEAVAEAEAEGEATYTAAGWLFGLRQAMAATPA